MTKLDMPMAYNRPRSREFSDKARRQMARSAYERQNKPVEVTLAKPPWEKKAMTVKTLPEADEAHLVFLRRHVDHLEQLLFKDTSSVSLVHELDSARNELHRFVEDRRAQGYNV